MDIRGQTKPNLSADPKSEYKVAMYSEITLSVSGLNTLLVRVRVVSLSGLCPVRVVSLSGLCPCPGCVCPGCVLSRLRPVWIVSCPGYVPVQVVSVRDVSVRVASCPGCVCPGCVLAPNLDHKATVWPVSQLS